MEQGTSSCHTILVHRTLGAEEQKWNNHCSSRFSPCHMESSSNMSKSKNGNGHAGSGVFGSPDRVLVKRGLAEFRSGRPVVFSSHSTKFLIALPVDGLDEARLHAFEHLCAPA